MNFQTNFARLIMDIKLRRNKFGNLLYLALFKK